MVQSELIKDGTLIRNYSDTGMKIRQIETGSLYDEAIDVLPLRYTYVETSEPISEEPEGTELEQLQDYYTSTQAVLPEETT